MQACILPQRSGLAGPPATSATGIASDPGLPAPFTERQARLVLAMREWGIRGADAARLLATWPPEIFSKSQAACVLELVELQVDDLCEVLADTMAPSILRGGLFRRRDFAETRIRWHDESETLAARTTHVRDA
jgi:hypothetical protein